MLVLTAVAKLKRGIKGGNNNIKTVVENQVQEEAEGQAGEATGDLFVTLIGPINKQPINMMIPDFVAGFIYQMTGDNNLTEI